MNKKFSVLLRADGNSKIGLGHIYRCLAIAERLSQEFTFYFAIQNPSKEIVNIVSRYSEILCLPETRNFRQEALEICTIISTVLPKIVVLDGYYFNTEYQRILKTCDIKLISIDDNQPYYYVSDVVINHAEGVPAEKISAEPDTKKFIGFKYALLRKKFIELSKSSRTIREIRRVLICFGGADPQNFTMRVLDAAKINNSIKEIHVILGNAFLYREQLFEICKNDEKIFLHSDLDEFGLIKIMLKCELAVIPASTIAMEAFAAKMILLTGTTIQNQKYISEGLSNYKNVTVVGDFNSIDQANLENWINLIIHNFQEFHVPPLSCSSDSLLKIFKEIL